MLSAVVSSSASTEWTTSMGLNVASAGADFVDVLALADRNSEATFEDVGELLMFVRVRLRTVALREVDLRHLEVLATQNGPPSPASSRRRGGWCRQS